MKESDIRPSDILNRFLQLCSEDSVIYFKDCAKKDIPCPACVSKQVKRSFNKWGFDYVVCQECGTLYQSPRPPQENFERFYQESRSAQYWAKTFFPSVAEARREHLFRPKVEKIIQLCNDDKFSPSVVVDIGAGYGLFLEEWRKKFPKAELVAIEPNADLANVCRAKGLKVVESFVEDVDSHGIYDMLVALELIEHIYEPYKFCFSLKQFLKKNGRLLLTGLTVDGFDIQVLWEHSKSVSPPQHINFISVLGFKKLLSRVGFSKVRIFTPGKLDVDIVKNFLAEKPDILGNQRMVKNLLAKDDEALKDFQEFLSKHQLSSHCWIWAEK